MPSSAAWRSTRSRNGPLPASTRRAAGRTRTSRAKASSSMAWFLNAWNRAAYSATNSSAPIPCCLRNPEGCGRNRSASTALGMSTTPACPRSRSFWMLVPLAIKASARGTPPRGS